MDHMTVRVRDIGRTRAFYDVALAPLGYKLSFDQVHDGVHILGYACEGRFDTWFTDTPPPSGPTHVAWTADTRAAVDEFHRAAVAAGGRDNGGPGERPHYHPGYYGAFVLDPDGNNVEAVCHAPPG
jgi:catechol 2,3-dioxygenase-like lactoylglutathione lyase family enzyme